VQKEFLLDSLLLQPLPLPYACLLAVKSIFHYYSWQWQLVVGFVSHLVIRPWLAYLDLGEGIYNSRAWTLGDIYLCK